MYFFGKFSRSLLGWCGGTPVGDEHLQTRGVSRVHVFAIEELLYG